ncbi:MAG: hypothetical protein N2749_06890 [Clostridia bacterium]|nr:hypothetical protein [Clostridia bacterium]
MAQNLLIISEKSDCQHYTAAVLLSKLNGHRVTVQYAEKGKNGNLKSDTVKKLIKSSITDPNEIRFLKSASKFRVLHHIVESAQPLENKLEEISRSLRSLQDHQQQKNVSNELAFV